MTRESGLCGNQVDLLNQGDDQTREEQSAGDRSASSLPR